jgi:hypothetical protein
MKVKKEEGNSTGFFVIFIPMRLLSQIIVDGPGRKATIQLLQGDLTALPKEHNADILVISAFPNDYTALPGSLMCALKEKGIDVGEMAKDKSVDLVSRLGCWLSKPLSTAQQDQFNFKQILCFEPSRQDGSPEMVVGNIFRCINNFVFDDQNNVIAMPVLASGKQKVPIEKMLPAMLDACIFWLQSGIPLDAIKLMVHTDEQAHVALPLFDRVRLSSAAPAKSASPGPSAPASPSAAPSVSPLPASSEPPSRSAAPSLSSSSTPSTRAAPTGAAILPLQAAPVTTMPLSSSPVPPSPDFDLFISYSHFQSQQVAELVEALKEKDGSLKVFYDRSSIPPGAMWIRLISDAIQHSKYVVCILSPQYRDSDACWDEFQCAKAKEFRTKSSVIKTINFITDAEMPLIMAVYSYIDCTEGDILKLKDAVNMLL